MSPTKNNTYIRIFLRMRPKSSSSEKFCGNGVAKLLEPQPRRVYTAIRQFFLFNAIIKLCIYAALASPIAPCIQAHFKTLFFKISASTPPTGSSSTIGQAAGRCASRTKSRNSRPPSGALISSRENLRSCAELPEHIRTTLQTLTLANQTNPS